MNNNQTFGVNQTLTGYYKVGVVSPDGEVTWKTEGKNLILNQGMDSIASRAIADQMLYAIAGTGTRPNSRNSGTSAISQSGATIYLNDTSGLIQDFSSSFDAYQNLCTVGDTIQWANGSQSLVTATGSNGFNLTVTPSVTFGLMGRFDTIRVMLDSRGQRRRIISTRTCVMRDWCSTGRGRKRVRPFSRMDRNIQQMSREALFGLKILPRLLPQFVYSVPAMERSGLSLWDAQLCNV